MSPAQPQRLFESGLQFYAVGRHSVFARANLVAGRLLHDAFQLFLIGALGLDASAAMNPLGEIRGSQHRPGKLQDLWEAFRSKLPRAGLDRFDRTIRELSRFEDLECANAKIARGQICSIRAIRDPDAIEKAWGRPELPHELALEEIDALAKALFVAAAGVGAELALEPQERGLSIAATTSAEACAPHPHALSANP